MTSSDHQNHTALKPPSKEAGPRKTAPSRPLEPALRCPRCDSPNTKFCYYNNYSLSQPRHFCKSCRRYWTRGGALRNVPVGGGSRKNKRIIKSSPSSSSPSSSSSPIFFSASDSLYKDSFENIAGGFKFFHGLSLNRLTNPSPRGIVYESVQSSSRFDLGHESGLITNPEIDNMGSININTSLASSIESLSSLNQDLHWKLQQQRLAMLFGHDNPKEMISNDIALSGNHTSPVIEKPQQIMFQNLEISSKPENIVVDSLRKECVVGAIGESATDQWFYGNSTFSSSSVCSATTMAGASSSGNNANSEGNMGNWHGVQAWSDLHHHQYNNFFP